MQWSISNKIGNVTIFFLILSAGFGTLYYVNEFVKMGGLLTTRTINRYDLLKKYFSDSALMKEYIVNNENRLNMYDQVVWHIIDSLPIRVIEPRPNSSMSFFYGIGSKHSNLMKNVTEYVTTEKESAGVYSFLADEPTMSGPRASSLGTGAFTAYVKVTIAVIQTIVFLLII
jgi:hypothetical protein